MVQVNLVVQLFDPALRAAVGSLAGYLDRCGLRVEVTARPVPAQAQAVLIYSDRAPDEAAEDELLALAHRGVPVLLAGPTVHAWRTADRLLGAAGLLPGPRTPLHETRLRPGAQAGEVTARMPGELALSERWPTLDKVLDDVAVLLTASMATVEHPVMTRRGALGALTLGGHPPTVAHPEYQRLVHRWLRAALGLRDGAAVRVGILGYGAVGHQHNAAISAVAGLELTAVCDLDPARVQAARSLAPDLVGYDNADALLAADDVDLVIVSTPPNSHARWARLALAAGKSTVVEKPFCLTVAEADEVIEAATAAGLALAVYQNRRWDADYLALKRLVRSGVIGEVFHYESFAGSYGHPCNYWHSDERISGGAVYDWGSHYLDWALDLLPHPVEQVTAATHKRVWHDVTNADHTRVTIRFAGGVEAEFVHSDLAAATKPKWYVLGTAGAVRGDWRYERVLSRDLVGSLVEDPLTPAESPAELTLFTPEGTGGVHETRVAVPAAPRHPFHRELADHLLCGEPMSVTPLDSRRTVAVMEAATISARRGGAPVPLP